MFSTVTGTLAWISFSPFSCLPPHPANRKRKGTIADTLNRIIFMVHSSFFIFNSSLLFKKVDFIPDLQYPDLVLVEAFPHRQVIFYSYQIICDGSGSFDDQFLLLVYKQFRI